MMKIPNSDAAIMPPNTGVPTARRVTAPAPFVRVRRISDRVVPGDFAPWVLDPFSDHRLENAVFVRRVAIGEPALDAGMPFVGFAGLIRNHA